MLFFLEALRFQAQGNEAKATEILALYAQIKERVIKCTHSQHASHAVDFIFSRPISFGPTFISGSGIPKPSATRILALMRDEGVIRTIRPGVGRRLGLYQFSALLEITELDTQIQ